MFISQGVNGIGFILGIPGACGGEGSLVISVGSFQSLHLPVVAVKEWDKNTEISFLWVLLNYFSMIDGWFAGWLFSVFKMVFIHMSDKCNLGPGLK